jgi:hypothetical protein
MPMTTGSIWILAAMALVSSGGVGYARPAATLNDAAPGQHPVPPGIWSEGKLYNFRLERIEPCGPGPTSTLRGDTTWVGAFFSVQAKDPELFVSPRDLELQRGGVILAATYVTPPTLSGCKPLLVARRLRAGEHISGFALFEVPKAFRVKTSDPIVIHYRPTRWGGARRAEVPVPECFDSCVKVWVQETPEARPPRVRRPRTKL